MRPAGEPLLSGSRPLRVALTQVAALAVVLGLVEAVLLVGSPEGPFVVTVLQPLTAWAYVGVGMVAWSRRPGNRMGPLLCAGGILWLVAGLANTTHPVLTVVGYAGSLLPVAVVLHALLAFPSGRLRDTASRIVVAAGYAGMVLLQVPGWLFAQPMVAGPNPLQIADRPDLAALGRDASSVLFVTVIAATAVLLVRYLRAATPQARRPLLLLYGYGGLATVVVAFAGNVVRVTQVDPLAVFVVQVALLAGVPVAFTAGLLLGGFARTAEIEELGAWLGSADRGRDELGAALARTLGDPSASLAFRTDAGGWVDGSGHPVELPADRANVPVRLGDRTVGAIVYDATLLPDPETVRATGGVVAIAVDRERLTALLLAEREQLRDSRTRLVEAGDRERRHLAQDLHDRLQGRLVMLALRAGTLEPGGPAHDIERIREDLADVISELRLVVQGVMPNLLIERGLAAAVRDIAERSPVRAVLDVDDDGNGERLPESIEGTAYHLVAEAVTNAVKHACAGELRISLRRRRALLRIEVADDGVGGATPVGGAGLRGIADRVDALGGHLEIHSPPSAGTRLVVEIPCGS